MRLRVGVVGMFFTLALSYGEGLSSTSTSNSDEEIQSPPIFGYIPYSYRISMKSLLKEEILNLEDSIYFNSPMGLINSVMRYSDTFNFTNRDPSKEFMDDIFNFAMEIHTSITYSGNDEVINSIAVNKQKKRLISSTQKSLKDKNPIKRKKETKKSNKNKINRPKKTPVKKKILYVVKKGDTFIKLAKNFNTTVFDIKRWNGIKKRNLVRKDEKLIIYPNKKTPYKKIKLIKKLESYGKYRVQAKDTLSLIIKRFAVSKKEVLELNRLKSKNSIRVGQKLIIPLSQKKIDTILKKIEEKRRAKRIALEKKRKLEMAKKGKYEIYRTDAFKFKRKIRVVATAYTSHRTQTDNTPFIAAWNNRIKPGMRVIAVSHDLIRRYGITNGTKVRISGLPGVYVVRDKMHPRLKKHIDIYMGKSILRALRWGRRRVILYW